MQTERQQRAAEVFKSALDCCAEELEAFLNEQCAGDHALRTEIEALLAADAAADQFLELQARTTETQPDREPAHSMIGRQIGRYKIRRLIASGGMGTCTRPSRNSRAGLWR